LPPLEDAEIPTEYNTQTGAILDGHDVPEFDPKSSAMVTEPEKTQEPDSNSPGKTRSQHQKNAEEKSSGDTKTGSARARSPSQLAVEEKMKKKASLQTTLKIASDPLTRSVALETRKPAHVSTGLRGRPTIP